LPWALAGFNLGVEAGQPMLGWVLVSQALVGQSLGTPMWCAADRCCCGAAGQLVVLAAGSGI
jgi:hypothetical protein